MRFELVLVPAAVALGLLGVGVSPGGEKLQEKTFEKEITVKVKLNYLLYLPKGTRRRRKRTGR